MTPTLWIISPCYNEQEVFKSSTDILSKKLREMIVSELVSSTSKIVFVDDGSTDSTWQLIEEAQEKNEHIIGIKLSRNFGQMHALMAGMDYARDKCDCIISIDVDLQDDIETFPIFIERFNEGYDIVYGARNDRQGDSWMKRNTAKLFYTLMRKNGSKIVANHSEYRLLSNRALRALQEYKETNFFLREIVSQLGFKSTVVYYANKSRLYGATKYSYKKLICLALNSFVLTSSERMVRVLLLIGAGMLGLGIMGVQCSPLVVGGVIILCLGLLGEYIRKIFHETRKRPRYIVEEIIGESI